MDSSTWRSGPCSLDVVDANSLICGSLAGAPTAVIRQLSCGSLFSHLGLLVIKLSPRTHLNREDYRELSSGEGGLGAALHR